MWHHSLTKSCKFTGLATAITVITPGATQSWLLHPVIFMRFHEIFTVRVKSYMTITAITII